MIDKKELKKQYKMTPPAMGVYQVKNLATGKILIGSSMNLPGRNNRFQFELENKSHHNSELEADFKKYNKENFVFEVLDTLEPKENPDYDYKDDLKVLEELWLEKLQPYEAKGYNKPERK